MRNLDAAMIKAPSVALGQEYLRQRQTFEKLAERYALRATGDSLLASSRRENPSSDRAVGLELAAQIFYNAEKDLAGTSLPLRVIVDRTKAKTAFDVVDQIGAFAAHNSEDITKVVFGTAILVAGGGSVPGTGTAISIAGKIPNLIYKNTDSPTLTAMSAPGGTLIAVPLTEAVLVYQGVKALYHATGDNALATGGIVATIAPIVLPIGIAIVAPVVGVVGAPVALAYGLYSLVDSWWGEGDTVPTENPLALRNRLRGQEQPIRNVKAVALLAGVDYHKRIRSDLKNYGLDAPPKFVTRRELIKNVEIGGSIFLGGIALLTLLYFLTKEA